jgi:hypothetical protein
MFIEYVHHGNLDVNKLKASHIFVRSICETMSFYDPNWKDMLNDSRCAKSPRFVHVHKYVKDALKDKVALKSKIDQLNDDATVMDEKQSLDGEMSFDDSEQEAPSLAEIPPKDYVKDTKATEPPEIQIDSSTNALTNPVSYASKKISKDRNEVFLQKMLRRYPTEIQRIRKIRKRIIQNSREFNDAKQKVQDTFFYCIENSHESSSDFSESE